MPLFERERPDRMTITYRIISLLEQQEAYRGENTKIHAEYRATGKTADLDRLARESGMKYEDFYETLAGKRRFTPNERYRLCQALGVAESAIWY